MKELCLMISGVHDMCKHLIHSYRLIHGWCRVLYANVNNATMRVDGHQGAHSGWETSSVVWLAPVQRGQFSHDIRHPRCSGLGTQLTSTRSGGSSSTLGNRGSLKPLGLPATNPGYSALVLRREDQSKVFSSFALSSQTDESSGSPLKGPTSC